MPPRAQSPQPQQQEHPTELRCSRSSTFPVRFGSLRLVSGPWFCGSICVFLRHQNPSHGWISGLDGAENGAVALSEGHSAKVDIGNAALVPSAAQFRRISQLARTSPKRFVSSLVSMISPKPVTRDDAINLMALSGYQAN